MLTFETPWAVAVTWKHIAAGKPGEPCNCPIALAVIDASGNPGLRVEVSGGTVWAWDGDMQHREFGAPWDEGIFEFVEAFDARDPVRPFTAILDWRPQSC